MNVFAHFNELRPVVYKGPSRCVHLTNIWCSYPVGLFDGATSMNMCGSGAFIVIKCGHFYHFCWNGGRGSNPRVETVAL